MVGCHDLDATNHKNRFTPWAVLKCRPQAFPETIAVTLVFLIVSIAGRRDVKNRRQPQTEG